ncbi:HD domain-containing protein [bacterium]|nr:HD domain-containing protein [bacterium]
MLPSPPPSSKRFFVADIKPQDTVRTTFLVRSKGVQQAKNGRPYLVLTLADRTGCIDTRVWAEDADALASTFREGDVVAVSGRAQWFQNRMQLVLDNLVAVDEPGPLEDFVPKADGDSLQRFAELVSVFETLECPWTRQVALALLSNPEVASRYPLSPAAKSIHHAYIGGLLLHSLTLVRLVQAVAPFYPRLNRSFLLFGAAFHDFGKIFELSYEGNLGYTDEGRLVGHIAIGTVLLDREIQKIPNFPAEIEWQLKHLILSHHGKIEYGSPVKPQTLEAQLVHHLDDMDSKLNSIQELMDGEKSQARWTSVHRAYEAAYYRPVIKSSEE